MRSDACEASALSSSDVDARAQAEITIEYVKVLGFSETEDVDDDEKCLSVGGDSDEQECK